MPGPGPGAGIEEELKLLSWWGRLTRQPAVTFTLMEDALWRQGTQKGHLTQLGEGMLGAEQYLAG